MKITDVEVIILESPEDYGMKEGASDSHGPKYAGIVKVHTDEGITGVADCDTHPHVIKALIDIPVYIPAFAEGLKQAVIGENPYEVERIWRKMYRYSFYHGRRGAAIHAMSAIDNAIWDIIGKATKQPVSVMLGGRNHERVLAYASTLFRSTREGMKEAVQKYRSLGFKAMKFGYGVVWEDPRKIVKLVEAARLEAGDDMEIMVDGMWTADVKLAIELVKEITQYNVFFVEEPLISDNLQGYKKLSNAVDARIACGEQLGGLFEYRQLIEEGDVDVIQPDLSRAGGLTEVRKLVQLVEHTGKLLIPHAWTSDLLTAVSLHLNSYQQNAIFQEYCTNDTVLSREMVIEPFKLDSEGYLHVPTKPGIGVELNEDVIKKYQIEGIRVID